MKPHKWHKEIKAWADGAEIESRVKEAHGWSEWESFEEFYWYEGERYEYRIKPQPKEPQYLYVYKRISGGNICLSEEGGWCNKTFLYLGKTKLEVDDE